MASEAGPPAHEVPVEQARAGHAAETEHLAGEGVAVARVRDDDRGRRARAGLRARGRERHDRLPARRRLGAGQPRLRRRGLPRARERVRARAWSASTTGSRPSTRSRPGCRTRSPSTRAVEADVDRRRQRRREHRRRRRPAAARAAEAPAADLPRHRRGREHAVLLGVRRALRAHGGLDAALLAASTSTAPTACTPDASPLRGDLEGSRPRTSSPPATTSCATRARPTRPRSSAPACRSRCGASRARSTASGAGRRPRSPGTPCARPPSRSAPR